MSDISLKVTLNMFCDNEATPKGIHKWLDTSSNKNWKKSNS